jgi:hypothetical protein
VDPKVSQTDEPYVFTGDSPLNATDPLGLSIGGANGESCISLSACSNPSVQARNQGIESAASTAAFWAGVKAYLAMQRATQQAEIRAAEPAAVQTPTTGNSGGILGAFQSLSEAIGGGPQMSQVPFGIAGGGGCLPAPGKVVVTGAGVAAGSGGIGFVGYSMTMTGGETALSTGLETGGFGLLVGAMILVIGGVIWWASSSPSETGSC